jgi:hypothetical protein
MALLAFVENQSHRCRQAVPAFLLERQLFLPGAGELHDASIVSLEELFDEARLSADYERKGWSPPGVTRGPVPAWSS